MTSGILRSRLATCTISCSVIPALRTRTSAVWASSAVHCSSIFWIDSITASFSSSIRLLSPSTAVGSKFACACSCSTFCVNSARTTASTRAA